MEFKDYYKVLGLERTATQDEIKRAYRKLARKYHPDINKEVGAEAQFKELGEAYEVLGDAEKRAAYDQLGTSGNPVRSSSRRPIGMLVSSFLASLRTAPLTISAISSRTCSPGLAAVRDPRARRTSFMHAARTTMPRS